jgi:hypothetical protein
MGTAFPLADPSISGQLAGSRVTGDVKYNFTSLISVLTKTSVYGDLRLGAKND